MTTETNASTFKDRNRALQELVREYMVLREHNLQFKEGDDLRRLLLFSEAAIVIVIIEHFARMVLATRATDQDTLHNLLQKAFADDRRQAYGYPRRSRPACAHRRNLRRLRPSAEAVDRHLGDVIERR